MPKKVTPIPKPSHPRFFFREWRKYRGLNQEALAEIVGVTTSTISQLETGKQGFTDSTLVALADAPPTPIPLPSISGRFALEASAQTRGFFDSSLLAGVRKLFFILTEIKLD